MSPYLGYVILQDNYNLALGLLVFAGVTDLVRFIRTSVIFILNNPFLMYLKFIYL